MDPISDVFTALEVQSVFYGRYEFGAPWGIRFPPGHASFGMVLRGQCWLQVEGSGELAVDGGDCYVLPRGVAYSLRNDADSALVDIDQVIQTLDTSHRYGGDGRTTVMLTGCFTLDSSFSKPVIDLLPSTIHIKADEPQSAPLQNTIRLLATEMQQDAPGSQVIVNRLTDVFFLQAIRLYMSRNTGCSSHWLRAVGDPQVGRVLTAMHGDMARLWTVEELAAEGGMSRAGFAMRFKQLVGETPLEYLTRWRMYKATRLLRDRGRKLLEVANSVGYDSDAAFNRAFKRMHGVSAGEYRRTIAATQ
jgi:AraC-like DNA-binding protein